MLLGYLDYLAREGNPAQARLLFELRLVKHLGYIPHLLHCSECFVVFDEEQIVFDPQRGGSLCRTCAASDVLLEVGLGSLGSLSRSLQTSADLFEGFHLGARTLIDGAAMMNLVLRSILPRIPKSLRFLEQISVPTEP